MADEKLRVYADAEIPAQLAEHGLVGWYVEDGWLRRKYTTSGWPVTLLLVNAIGYLAEAAWHHPDAKSGSLGQTLFTGHKLLNLSNCAVRDV